MSTIHPRPPRESPPRGEKWFTCRLCGGNKYTRVHIHFTSGSVEPEVGETLTDNDGSDTGVVTDVWTHKGTWAGGDCEGQILMSGATGVDADTLRWGTDGGNVNGSVGGSNILTLDGYGTEQTYGIMYPKSLIRERDGVKYCVWHYNMKFIPYDRDQVAVELDESDRWED